MDIYFDVLGFEEKVKKIYNDFCNENSLVLSSKGQNFIFIDTNKTNALQDTFLSNLTHINSAWLKLKVSKDYTAELIERLYQGLDAQNSRYLEALNKHITKTFSPEDVSLYLDKNKENQLEDFLLSKKTQSSIGWSSPEVFDYINKIFKYKSDLAKTAMLHTILKNNKWNAKSIEIKSALEKFVRLNIAKQYSEEFNKYYEDFQKNYNQTFNLFNTPENVFMIEINKNALYSQIVLEEKSTVINEKLHEEMLKNLSKVFSSKKIARKLGILNLEITQTLSSFPQLRLIFDALDKKNKDEEKMKKFLNLYLECYSNSFPGINPSKQSLFSMVEKIVMTMDLESILINKENTPVIKNKI